MVFTTLATIALSGVALVAGIVLGYALVYACVLAVKALEETHE